MNSAVGSKLSLRERRVFDEKAARVLVLGGAACARNESDGVASGVVSVDLHHAVPRFSLSVGGVSMARCLHAWTKEFQRGFWYGWFRCKRCRTRAVCPACYGAAPSGATVRYCDRHW